MSKTRVYFRLDKNFATFENWLKTMQDSEIHNMKDRMARSIVERGFQHAASSTPTNSSRLKRSMAPGATESFVKIDVKPGLTIAVYGTTVPYAAAIEKGFSQEKRKGQFVPGYWAGNTFKYIPGFKSGMVLTGKVIDGKHMFEKSLDQLRDSGDLTKIFVGEFERVWGDLLKQQGPVGQF